jgi:ribonuclease P protein subunit RPR2
VILSFAGLFLFGRLFGALDPAKGNIEPSLPAVTGPRSARERLSVLVINDDADLRLLLRTSLELDGIDVDEADSVEAAVARLAWSRPGAIVLDIGLPGTDSFGFCGRIKTDPETSSIPILLLSALGEEIEERALAAGADGVLAKPPNPLELLALVRGLATASTPPLAQPSRDESRAQLLDYAEDLRHLLEVEQEQQSLLRSGYRETVAALAAALACKDAGTSAHVDRVVGYASELTLAVAPAMSDDPSLEYGFLLHDVGKIGVPDGILQKPGPLTAPERRAMEKHTLVGEEMLRHVPLLADEGLKVIRSHHERWDGDGYPDRLSTTKIPQSARIFAVADALEAITSDRPYRPASSWKTALSELRREAGAQFDPEVVEALEAREEQLRTVSLRPTRASRAV